MIFRNELMNVQPGAYFFQAMHPAHAPNKSLISNTALVYHESELWFDHWLMSYSKKTKKKGPCNKVCY